MGDGVGALVGVVVPDGAAVGLGVAVGFDVALGVGFPVDGGVGVFEGTETAVGLINITLIALSSGTGESTFLLDNTTPIMMTIKITTPTMIVSAAIVLRRSSILRLEYNTLHNALT